MFAASTATASSCRAGPPPAGASPSTPSSSHAAAPPPLPEPSTPAAPPPPEEAVALLRSRIGRCSPAGSSARRSRSRRSSYAVARGVGIVVLDAGEEDGGRAYEAARALKALVGDRADLLIAERVDVASAVGASGVVLADDGIPAIVARSMMMKSNSDSICLPLVARTKRSPDSARSASSSEVADFLIVNTGSDDFLSGMNGGGGGSQHVKIPIFFNLNESESERTYSDITARLLQSGASGIVMSLAGVQLLTDGIIERDFFSKVDPTDCPASQLLFC